MNGENLTLPVKIFSKIMNITPKTRDGDQTIPDQNQKLIAMMTNTSKYLKFFHCILLDYPIRMHNQLDIVILDKNWKDYTPKIFVLGKSLLANLIIVKMVNVPLPAIQKTIMFILTALDVKGIYFMEPPSTIAPYLHAVNLILSWISPFWLITHGGPNPFLSDYTIIIFI